MCVIIVTFDLLLNASVSSRLYTKPNTCLISIILTYYSQSNIIKGKIQHDKTFAAAAAIATAIN